MRKIDYQACHHVPQDKAIIYRLRHHITPDGECFFADTNQLHWQLGQAIIIDRYKPLRGKILRLMTMDIDSTLPRARLQLIPHPPSWRPPSRPLLKQTQQCAIIESPHQDSACLDEQGHYYCFFPHAQTRRVACHNSPTIPLATPYAGYQHGWHFPMGDRALVMLTYLHGDANQPIILGSLPYCDNLSPVTSDNYPQHILRASRGETLLLDDGHSPRIALHTAGEQSSISMETNAEQASLCVKHHTGNITLHAKAIDFISDKHFTLSSEDSHHLSAERSIMIDCQQGRVRWRTEASMAIHCESLHQQSEQDILWQTDGAMHIKALRDIHGKTQQGDVVMISEKNTIQLQGKQGVHCTTADGGTSLQVGKASLLIDKTVIPHLKIYFYKFTI